jgi:DNA-binding MarR family transcriptional regulator
MVKLAETGACSQNHLARLVALDAATINGVLVRLRRRGFIATKPDPADARQRIAALTSAGRRVAEPAVEVAKRITRETLAPLAPAEQAKLSRLLKKIS